LHEVLRNRILIRTTSWTLADGVRKAALLGPAAIQKKKLRRALGVRKTRGWRADRRLQNSRED